MNDEPGTPGFIINHSSFIVRNRPLYASSFALTEGGNEQYNYLSV